MHSRVSFSSGSSADTPERLPYPGPCGSHDVGVGIDRVTGTRPQPWNGSAVRRQRRRRRRRRGAAVAAAVTVVVALLGTYAIARGSGDGEPATPPAAASAPAAP